MSTLGDLTVPKIDQSGPPKTGEFTYIDISSIDNELKRVVEPKRLPVGTAPSRAKLRIQPGDVLVSMTRPNLNAVAIVSPDLKGAIGSTGFHVLRPVQGIEPRWLFYGVQTHAFVEAMSSLVQGALYPAVRPKDIKGFGLDAPSWSEQQRIVAEIEKQFSRLDEAVANLKRVKANLKRYKASVLKAAVEGKLTEDWRKQHPNVEPASKLLERILAERRAKWSGKGKYKEPNEPDSSNLPELPEGWSWCAVDQVSRKITDGEHISPTCQSAGVPLLSAKDVRESGALFDEVKYVSPEDAKRFRMRCDPDRNDILIVSRGATIGRSCIVKTDQVFCLMGSVILLKLLEEIAAPYAITALKSVSAVKRLVGASGSTAQQAIYIQDIRSLPFPLPPYEEQEQIVAEVERRLSVIEELEAAVEANLTRADRLRQSILQTAFEGKLVTQSNHAAVTAG